MTRTYRALNRVRHAAHRLIVAVEALRPGLTALPGATRASLWGARAVALIVERRLTDVLGPEEVIITDGMRRGRVPLKPKEDA